MSADIAASATSNGKEFDRSGILRISQNSVAKGRKVKVLDMMAEGDRVATWTEAVDDGWRRTVIDRFEGDKLVESWGLHNPPS